MNTTTSFEEQLHAEETALRKELSTLGTKNPGTENDWELAEPDLDINPADRNEAADRLEELEEHGALLENMEERLHEVEAALARTKEGTFGLCEVCGGKIEPERLHANACARTCKAHMDGMRAI